MSLQADVMTEVPHPIAASLPPRRDVHVANTRLSIIDEGEGEAVLLLHGYPQSLLTWRHQIPTLATRARVIAPDWFGWGLSERGFATPARYWDEVGRIGLLLDALDVERCTLVGHDYGGFLGLGFAIRNPDRVERLSIINSRAHRTFPQPTYMQFAILCAMARVPGLRQLVHLVPLGRLNKALLQRHVRQGCFDNALLDHYVGWMDTPEGRRWVAHFFRYYQMPARRDLDLAVDRIACPTTIIWGDKDPYCPVEIGRDLAARIPGARMVPIKGADHYVMEERPDEVLAALTSFLERPVTR